MDLDKLLTPQECAAWLGVEQHALSRMSSGRNPRIPAIRLSRKTVLYHPRTALAAWHRRAGLGEDVIRMALNESPASS